MNNSNRTIRRSSTHVGFGIFNKRADIDASRITTENNVNKEVKESWADVEKKRNRLSLIKQAVARLPKRETPVLVKGAECPHCKRVMRDTNNHEGGMCTHKHNAPEASTIGEI